MKIALINTEKGFRGGERQTLYLARGLIKNNIDVDVLAPFNSPLIEKSKNMGLNFVHFKGRLSLFFKLIKIGKNYDCLVPFTSKAHDIAILYKIFSGTKVIYTRRVNFKPSKFSMKFKYKKTDLIVAISNSIKETLNEDGLKNVVVIPSFVLKKNLNVNRVEKYKKSFENRKIIGVISAFTEEKNPFILLKICGELLKRRDDFVIFHFGDGKLRSEFEREMKKLKLEKNYKVFGYVEDVEDFYSIFDVFLMVSKSEGLGSSVLDAFFYGVPVVSSDSGGLKEVVSGHGILCRYDDVDCFVSGILKLFEDEVLREKFIKDGMTFVENNFSEKIVVDKFLKVLKSVSNT